MKRQTLNQVLSTDEVRRREPAIETSCSRAAQRNSRGGSPISAFLVAALIASAAAARRTGLRHAVFVCGIGMSVSMLAIGWTPLNLVPKLHDPVTAVTAIAAALAILGLITDSSDWLENPRGKRIWLVILISVSVVWSVLIALHYERLLAFRPWLPLWQKILIATFVAWMAHQMVLLFRVREPDSTTERN